MHDLVLQTVAKLIIPFIQLFGFYIIFFGHLSPGGGFAGGTIVASSFILYALAYDVQAGFKRMPRLASKWLESMGALLFVLVGFAGVAMGGSYLANHTGLLDLGEAGTLISGGFIPLLTLAVGVKVASTIISLLYHLLEEKTNV